MRTRIGEDIGAGTVDGLVAERMSEGKATTVEREWVVVVVKEQGEERWENAELSHFASGRSAATKIKGRSSPKQRKGPVGSLPIPTVSVQDPCLPRNSAAIRGLASLFWCLYSQTRKKMATDLRLFSLGYDACRIVNTRWKFCVEEKCPAQFPLSSRSSAR